MTRLLQKPMLFIACGLMTATAAMAGVPSAANCTIPPCFSIVGSVAGVPDPVGAFTVTIRDLTNTPMNGASVVVDLSECTDIKLCCDQLDPGCFVCCLDKTVKKLTNPAGQVTFVVLGSSVGSGNASTVLGSAKFYANGVLIGAPDSPVFDLDGSSGVGINDLSVWLTDFGTANNPAFRRSNFDCSNGVGINDLSVWLTEFGTGLSAISCTTTSAGPALVKGNGPTGALVSCPKNQ